MKKILALLLCAVLTLGCAAFPVNAAESTENTGVIYEKNPAENGQAVAIVLSDAGITVDGGGETESVFTSHDIVYYQDLDAYESGNPYGEGSDKDKHTSEEADVHTVVNITAPGTYRVSGTLSAGQIYIDLGEDAESDPEAVVNLILDNADITCTVAPAIVFRNVYECDGDRTTENATPDVDTTAAGANLILAMDSVNTVHGSYVAKVYKDNDQQKKLVKQDGAVYSYMSMNVDGCGSLDIYAENEGLNSEMHLTICNGTICIRSQDDGINTNEDGVSVTTILGGDVHIIAGLGTEGDGIDSNGYLVIRGGRVVASANPASDSGLDSDMGSYIHGGTVIAMGSTMDWAESDSEQVTMNLQFAAYQTSAIVVTDETGSVIFAYDPAKDEVLAENARRYQGAVISCPDFEVGQTYQLYLGGNLIGEESCGFYAKDTVCTDGTQQMYTGSDLRSHGGFGGFGGREMPKDFDSNAMGGGMKGQRGEAFGDGQRGEGFKDGHREDGDFGEMGTPPEMPEGMEGMTPPEMPEGMENMTPPGMPGDGNMPFQGFEQTDDPAQGSTEFYMQDKVNAFTGIRNSE